MKEILLFLAFGALSMNANAQMTMSFCDDIAFIAREIMIDRQEGRPKEFNQTILDRMNSTGKERVAFQYVLDRAYQISVSDDPAKKAIAPSIFSNALYKACTKGVFDQ